jgi:DNA-binding response OmpR family regulator
VRDKHHVLIVKAEPQIAALWEQALERAGYLVSCVARACTALQRWEMERIDAVIIDAALPDMAGATLAQAIRVRWPESQVLLLVGTDPAASVHLAGDANLQLLPRTVTTRVLKQRLERLLPSHEQPHLYYGQQPRSIVGNASMLSS